MSSPLFTFISPVDSGFTAHYVHNGIYSNFILYYGLTPGDYIYRYIIPVDLGEATVTGVPVGNWYVVIQGIQDGVYSDYSDPYPVTVATSTARLPTLLSSNLSKWGVDTGDGVGLRAFPRNPVDYKIYPEGDPEVHLDGTANWSRYWIMELTFHVLTEVEYRAIVSRWASTRQKVTLNYMSGKNFGQGADAYSATSGWKRAPAIWRTPPQVGINAIRGMIVYDLVLTFNRVEWDGVL